MDSDRMWVVLGMEVVGPDGTAWGTVQQIRSPGFFVGDTRQRVIYLPFAAIADVAGNVLILALPWSTFAQLN